MIGSAHVITEQRAPRIQRASLGQSRPARYARRTEHRGQGISIMLPLLLVFLLLALVATTVTTLSKTTNTYTVTLTRLSTQQDIKQPLQVQQGRSMKASVRQGTAAANALYTARASVALTRINQLDASQYASPQQANDWSPSACSAASMTENINAYNAVYHTGPQYKIKDILQVESQIGEISPDLGMLNGASSISRTVSHFGYTSQDLSGLSLDDLIAVGNGGYPVIINFLPPGAGGHWDGGHVLLVKGGDRNQVTLVDSSTVQSATASQIKGGGNGLKEMQRDDFLYYWQGFAVVAMPKSLQGQFQQFYARLHAPTRRTTTTNGGAPKQTGAYSVLGKPTITADQINKTLAFYNSPAAGKGQALYDLGVQYGIDPIYALAYFGHESTFGTQGEARTTMSLGNLRCIPNYACVDQARGGYAQMPNWEEGFKTWYTLIHDLYVQQWGLSTVDQIIPRYAPSSDNNNEAAYINDLKKSVDRARAGYADIENFKAS